MFFAPLFTISAHHYLGTWNRLKKLQPVAKVFETLYGILAQMACPSSCACDPPSSPYQNCFVAIQDHAPNLEEQLSMDARKEVSNREFKQIATATSTTAVVDAVSWGEYVS